jgi:hypothetical protein
LTSGNENFEQFDQVHLYLLTCQTSNTDYDCGLGRTKPALSSSNEWSSCSKIFLAVLGAQETQGVAGVKAVSIGTEVVGGVEATGTGSVFGILFSSSTALTDFEGVSIGVLL